MDDKILPVEYYLEVFDADTDLRTPGYSVQTASPLGSICIGDKYEHLASGEWINPPKYGAAFYVKDIKHIIWEIDGSHIGHKKMVYLEKRLAQ